MPDMKTALSGILSEWELDNKQQEKQVETVRPYFSVTNNVTRVTFEYVKNNPASKYRDIAASLSKRGYKPASIGSLLTQFVRNGLCSRDEQDRYTAIVSEYVPIKARKKLKAKQVIQKAKATRGEGIAALSAQPTPKLAPAPIVTAWDADTIINNIGLKQARALYDELKKIFGG